MDILIGLCLVFAMFSLAVFELIGAEDKQHKIVCLVCIAFFVVVGILTLSLRLMSGIGG